ncbi:MAG: glycosyltransferase [Desulfamplus sp.]|nr:glycosyltransferase [Desulfamplus sp.]
MSSIISVIIPTFNRGWCINEALESVLDQNYLLMHPIFQNCQSKNHQLNSNRFQSDQPSVEVIVVDDGSTDNTHEILKPLIDQGLIKLLKQKNKGVSAARNFGIRQSCGDFIAFLDSDDLWLPDKLSCQMDFFAKNPEAMICQTEEIWIRNGKRVNPKHKHKKLSGMIFEPSLHLCLVSPSAVMMRREFFSIKGLFDEALPACEDYDLWLRTSTDMPIWLIDRPFIIKRGGHNDQLSSAHSLDKYRIRSIQNLLENSSNECTNTDSFDKTLGNIPDQTNLHRGTLNNSQRDAAIHVFREKCSIYSQGCLKRGKIEEAQFYREKSSLF